MNNVRKIKDFKKKKPYNNFERRHPDLAHWTTSKSEGPFFRYCQMLAHNLQETHRQVKTPCAQYFYSTRNRRMVGGVLMGNFWKANAEKSMSIGSRFDSFLYIGTPKTIKKILDQCVDAGFIYKDEPHSTAKHWTAKYVYFPTPLMIEAWMKQAERKINLLYEINITKVMEEINGWKDQKKGSILYNHPYHQEFIDMLQTEIENIEIEDRE